jgi:hypothetical protein
MKVRALMAVAAVAVGVGLTPAPAHASEVCVGDRGLDTYVTQAVAQHEMTPAQGRIARCQPGLVVNPVSTDSSMTTSTRPFLATSATANARSTVACTDRTKMTYSKNALGMVLMWHKTVVEWCWDSRMVITSGRSYSQYDTPGFCWGYDRTAPTTNLGGRGYGYWDVTRGSSFSCGVGSVALHRTLYARLRVTGGGGAS